MTSAQTWHHPRHDRHDGRWRILRRQLIGTNKETHPAQIFSDHPFRQRIRLRVGIVERGERLGSAQVSIRERMMTSMMAPEMHADMPPRRKGRNRDRPDVTATAQLLVSEHGGQAIGVAAGRALVMHERGDHGSEIVWCRIISAIQELLATRRQPASQA